VPKNVHIILPNRIGDSILALPTLLCLRQLLDRYENESPEVTVFSHVPLVRLFQSLGIFDFRPFDLTSKLRSLLNPPDKAFFLSTTRKNIGYRSRTSYGLRLANKRSVRYTVDLPSLDRSRIETALPAELLDFLRNRCDLPGYALRHFGICLELGFTATQIVEGFRFDASSLTVGEEYFDGPRDEGGDYVVFCMEAAYGRGHGADRRWDDGHFIGLAERLHADFGLESVFVGIHTTTPLPPKPYLKDLRARLTLDQMVRVLHFSRGYIGNDTGPLHLANLLRKRTVGLYHQDEARDYWPLFRQFNTVCTNTQGPDEVYRCLQQFARPFLPNPVP
jgi:hypothetical protein